MDDRTIIYLDDAIDAAVKGADPYYKDSIVEELMNVFNFLYRTIKIMLGRFAVWLIQFVT